MKTYGDLGWLTKKHVSHASKMEHILGEEQNQRHHANTPWCYPWTWRFQTIVNTGIIPQSSKAKFSISEKSPH